MKTDSLPTPTIEQIAAMQAEIKRLTVERDQARTVLAKVSTLAEAALIRRPIARSKKDLAALNTIVYLVREALPDA